MNVNLKMFPEMDGGRWSKAKPGRQTGEGRGLSYRYDWSYCKRGEGKCNSTRRQSFRVQR